MKVELAPGQVWTPTKPGGRAKGRTIVWVGKDAPAIRWFKFETVGWVNDPDNPSFPEFGHDGWMDTSSFRQWIRKHQAELSK